VLTDAGDDGDDECVMAAGVEALLKAIQKQQDDAKQ
jgi:hypothetical protein